MFVPRLIIVNVNLYGLNMVYYTNGLEIVDKAARLDSIVVAALGTSYETMAV
jgi:hypothetical protein